MDFQLHLHNWIGDGCSCSYRRRRGKVGGSARRPTRLSTPCHIRDRYHRVGPHTPDWVSVGRCWRDSALASPLVGVLWRRDMQLRSGGHRGPQ